ncbi:MAG TPA: hypothetical protein VH186_12520 [Chloroflexia bacterium]|nr:hypothetical protein [Chloroflexia bacterium]
MSPQRLVRWSGAALASGGLSFVLFLLLHPYNELAGAHASHMATWVPAHSFHFLGALLTLFGLVGLYIRQLRESGWLGLAGFVVSFCGMTMFAGTGLITAYIWPVIAKADPSFVEPDGPMFKDPLAIGVIDSTYAVMVVGFLLFGVAIYRARIFPRGGAILTMLGVILFSAPVEPVGPAPWIVRIAGACVFGAGLIWLGLALWLNTAVVAEEREPVPLG